MPDFILEALRPIPLILGAALTAITSHLWRRYRDRVITLNWQVTNHRIAKAGDDKRFGKIEVLYNGVAVSNVAISTIVIENNSAKDLKDLPINITYNDGTIVRISQGAVRNSANELRFTPDFDQALTHLISLKPDSPEFSELLSIVSKRRDYIVPVFNRGNSLSITLLVQGPQSGQAPDVNLNTDYLGVRLQKRPPAPVLLGVPLKQSVITGLIVGLIICLLISFAEIPNLATSIISYVVGAVATFIGIVVIKFAKLMGRLLS